jgi:hypothetical protein
METETAARPLRRSKALASRAVLGHPANGNGWTGSLHPAAPRILQASRGMVFATRCYAGNEDPWPLQESVS